MGAPLNLQLPLLGVIDIGSNSVRLVIYDRAGAHFTSVYNEKVLAGLGRDLKSTGRLSEKGRRLCLQALGRFDRIAKARGLGEVLVGATAALRMADDAPEFLDEIKTRTGLTITPISGDEEARLSALGLIAGDVRRAGIAADLGGASLELIQVADCKVGQRQSLPLGPFDAMGSELRGYDTHDYEAAIPLIESYLDQLPPELLSSDTLYLIGGAWRNLATVHQQRNLYPMRTLQAYAMSGDAAQTLAQWAYRDGRETLLDWSGMRKARAETLPFSGLMLDRLIRRIEPEQVVVSIAGLREGIVFDAFPREIQPRDALLDGCRDFARGFEQTENFGEPLFDFIEGLNPHWPIAFGGDNDARLRRAACLLAGIGKGLHPDYRPELVFNDVLYAPVAGLTHPERAFLAMTLFRSYSGKRDAPNQRAVDALLNADQISASEAIGEAIRLGIVATGQSVELLRAFRLSSDGARLCLSVNRDEGALITEQVIFRLGRLASKIGQDSDVDTHKA